MLRLVTRTEARRRNAFGDIESASEVVDRAPADAPADPERWLCNAIEAQILIEALRGLPRNYRKVIMLCDVEEMTNEAASTALAIPVNTVKSRRARAKRMLREALALSLEP